MKNNHLTKVKKKLGKKLAKREQKKTSTKKIEEEYIKKDVENNSSTILGKSFPAFDKLLNTLKKDKHISATFWFVVLLAFLVFLFFTPREIRDSEYNPSGLMMIFIILWFLVFKIMKPLYGYSIITILSITFLPIIFVSMSIMFHIYQKEKELLLHGKTTKCFVYYKTASGKKNESWLIKCKYFVDGVEFIASSDDKKNKYKVGDTLELVYNKEFPRMYQVNFE